MRLHYIRPLRLNLVSCVEYRKYIRKNLGKIFYDIYIYKFEENFFILFVRSPHIRWIINKYSVRAFLFIIRKGLKSLLKSTLRLLSSLCDQYHHRHHRHDYCYYSGSERLSKSWWRYPCGKPQSTVHSSLATYISVVVVWHDAIWPYRKSCCNSNPIRSFEISIEHHSLKIQFQSDRRLWYWFIIYIHVSTILLHR